VAAQHGDAGSQEQLSSIDHPPPRAGSSASAKLKGWLDRSSALARGFAGAADPVGPGAPSRQNLGGISMTDVGRMGQIYNLRRGAVITNEVPPLRGPEMARGAGVSAPQGGRAAHPEVPHDPTEDPIEHLVVSAEIGVGGGELGILGFQQAVGKLSAAGQGSEALGSLFGMMPEIIAVRAQNRLIGQTREGLEAEAVLKGKITEQARQLDRLLDRSPLLIEEEALAGERPDFAALRERLTDRRGDIEKNLYPRLEQTVNLLEQLYDGQDISDAHLREALREFERGRVLTGIAIAGGVLEAGGAAAVTVTEIGEHTIPHVVGAAGFGAGALGGALTLPFTAKFAYDNAKSIRPHAEASTQGRAALAATAEEKSATIGPVARPSALRRALAKLAIGRSEPRSRAVKTSLFGLAFAGSATGIAGYTAAALGATVTAGVLATVGMWIGIAALTGFTVYSLGRYVADRRKAGAYTTQALKKVITGEPNPISGPIKTRQTDKLLNRAFFASCEQFAHAAIVQARNPVAEGPRDFKTVLEDPLRKHAAALLDPGPYGTLGTQSTKLIDRMIDEIRSSLTLDDEGEILGPGFQAGNQPPGSGSDSAEDPVIASIKEAVTRALARTLRETNQSRTTLVQNRAQFSSAFDRIQVPGLASDSYQITAENRRAVAAVLAEFMPDRTAIDAWSSPGAGAPNDPDPGGPELYRLIGDEATDLARAAALRKLLRRDPEALLLTYVQSMRDARLAGDDSAQTQLGDDLKAFGVTDGTLETVVKASDDTQIFHAVGLLAKELKFMS